MFVGNNEFGIFQSTLPREERQTKRWLCRCDCDFNPRSHERSDTSVSCHVVVYTLFQSTLPREERLIQYDVNNILIKISIHAPTRGATLLQLCTKQLFSISIHAPTRGATIR